MTEQIVNELRNNHMLSFKIIPFRGGHIPDSDDYGYKNNYRYVYDINTANVYFDSMSEKGIPTWFGNVPVNVAMFQDNNLIKIFWNGEE